MIQAIQPQFGKLTLREKSLSEKAELDKQTLSWYRRARNERKQAIANLEKAGLDIEIRGTQGWTNSDEPEGQRKHYGSVMSYVLDSDRNMLAMTAHAAEDSPWTVVDVAVARALDNIEFENPRITEGDRYTELVKQVGDKLVPTGEGVIHRLSRRGKLHETGRINLNA